VAANAGEARRMYDLAKPRYEAVLKGFNQKLLYSTPWPASGIWAKGAVDTPEAVAKLKIRTYDKTGTDLMAALGATASVVSFADLRRSSRRAKSTQCSLRAMAGQAASSGNICRTSPRSITPCR
jgi:TRAP-type C4-dicarboxylate transport system substrate-binding protein